MSRNCLTSKAEVDWLLSREPSASALKARLHAIENLAADLKDHAPWPALQASLAADAERLRARLTGSARA